MSELPTHSQTGFELTGLQLGGSPLEELDAGSGRGERRGDHPVPVDVVLDEPLGQLLLAVGDAERVELLAAGGDAAAQRVQRDELLSGHRALSQPSQRAEQRLGGLVQRVDGASGRRRRVVDLVREPGREGAEGDQRLALAGLGLDAAHRVDQPRDEVDAEREPLAGHLTERLGGHAQQSARGHSPGRRHVDAVRVPGLETARPLARGAHHPELGLLVPDPADQAERPVEEHPPEVGRRPLAKGHVTGARRTTPSQPTRAGRAGRRRARRTARAPSGPQRTPLRASRPSPPGRRPSCRRPQVVARNRCTR